MKRQDLSYVIDAHQNFSKKDDNSFRKWDGRTSYTIHPLWCASTIATETKLDLKTREEGMMVLMYHDVLEDTTKGAPYHLSDRLVKLIEDMSFEDGSAQEMGEIWFKPKEVRLYKLYDKVSNLLDGDWMDEKKKKSYEEYTLKLYTDTITHYGELNIHKIARSIATEGYVFLL